jgi:hypothetical protein
MSAAKRKPDGPDFAKGVAVSSVVDGVALLGYAQGEPVAALHAAALVVPTLRRACEPPDSTGDGWRRNREDKPGLEPRGREAFCQCREMSLAFAQTSRTLIL